MPALWWKWYILQNLWELYLGKKYTRSHFQHLGLILKTSDSVQEFEQISVTLQNEPEVNRETQPILNFFFCFQKYWIRFKTGRSEQFRRWHGCDCVKLEPSSQGRRHQEECKWLRKSNLKLECAKKRNCLNLIYWENATFIVILWGSVLKSR